MLPVLSGDGSLEFPDVESLAMACEQLRKSGHFDVQAKGSLTPGLVRLRIHLPDTHAPIVHTAALRPGEAGRMRVGMSGAAALIERLERAAAIATPPGESPAPRETAPSGTVGEGPR